MNNNKLFKQLAIDCEEIIKQLETVSQDFIPWLDEEDVFDSDKDSIRVYMEPSHSPIDSILSTPLITLMKYIEIPPYNLSLFTVESDYLLIKCEEFSLSFYKYSNYFQIKRRGYRSNSREIPFKTYSVDFLKIIELYFKLFISISQLKNPTLEQVIECIENFFNKVKDICDKVEVKSNA